MEIEIRQTKEKGYENYFLFSTETQPQKRTIILEGIPYFVAVPKLLFSIFCKVEHNQFRATNLYVLSPEGVVPCIPNVIDSDGLVCLGSFNRKCKSPTEVVNYVIDRFWQSSFSYSFISTTARMTFVKNLMHNFIGLTDIISCPQQHFYSEIITENELNEYVKSTCR